MVIGQLNSHERQIDGHERGQWSSVHWSSELCMTKRSREKRNKVKQVSGQVSQLCDQVRSVVTRDWSSEPNKWFKVAKTDRSDHMY